MTFTEIYNKPTSIVSEDLLTSDVFGCCSFLKYSDLLQHLLESAVYFRDSEQHFITKKPVISDDYLFWPRFNTSVSKQTEPDLLIILWHSEKECSLALIESKFNSGKSSEADYDVEEITDQLARELLILESKEIFTQHPILSDVNIISKALFYVTADDIMPKESLNKSANEFVLKIKNKPDIEKIPFYWLPWWMIEHVIYQNKLSNHDDISKRRIVTHVWDILSEKRLKRFNGFKCFTIYPLSLAYNSDYKVSIRNYREFLLTPIKLFRLIYIFSKHI